ncbi:unnamed protein product [Staurois parvus]|uniref:Uncharacterized protein n=1 Tax=Staurois parvus TaxID=386267 RepID=A0ABN9BT17_9NEOB|nr:unnamed protein product [Staurois parvus]
MKKHLIHSSCICGQSIRVESNNTTYADNVTYPPGGNGSGDDRSRRWKHKCDCRISLTHKRRYR